MIAQPGSLLVVEDDGDIREFLAEDLRARGFRTETSVSCGDAIGRLREQSFDVVLCDVQLPDGDGLSVLRWCRQRPDPPVVILLTGYGSIVRAVEAMREGADDYLTKPIVDDELAASLSRAMARRIDGPHLASDPDPDPGSGFRIWIPDSDSGSGFRIWIPDSDSGSGFRIRIPEADSGFRIRIPDMDSGSGSRIRIPD